MDWLAGAIVWWYTWVMGVGQAFMYGRTAAAIVQQARQALQINRCRVRK
jgi:hypothetical protein